jgi:NADH:ubiquinone oxidoreductase subunit F (NADH-binding)/NADH:ubiquinone oxidoreductase subunit E/Pyruvate/2-oxoacid:ferredoxin oxidoreductase delta subunit
MTEHDWCFAPDHAAQLRVHWCLFVVFTFMPIDLTYADKVVARAGRKPEAVIPVLQQLQEHYGYLPEEALRRVCERSEITPAAIAGVASFYDMFRMQPTGKHIVRVCRGTACHVAGVGRVEDALRRHLAIPEGHHTDPHGNITIEPVACLGVCTLAPVLKFGEHTFGHTSAEGMPKLLREFEELKTAAGVTHSTEEIRATTKSPGAVEISVGLGSCCMAKGSANLFHALQDAAGATGGKVMVKRVGCVGMCHRTPMVEVTQPGRPGVYFSELATSNAAALVQHYAQPRSIAAQVRRTWVRLLDGLLLDDGKEKRAVQQHAIGQRDETLRAFFSKQVRIATEYFGKIDPLDLDEYVATGGFEALRKCLGNKSEIRNLRTENSEGAITPAARREEIVATMEQSGLRGRGGAGFPTGQKWRVVAQQPAATKYVICNGDEGDPGAFMDRMILESFPFRVIEGLMIAAVAVGAQEGIFYIRHEYPLAVKRVRAAIAELERRGWLVGGERPTSNIQHPTPNESLTPALSASEGERELPTPSARVQPENLVGTRSTASQTIDRKDGNADGTRPYQVQEPIQGEGIQSRFPFKLSVFEGAGAFVCGEETALIASIEGQRGMPKLRPPFPAQEGLWGKPTLINNVETLAMVPWIVRHGAEKFAAIGTAQSKGTKVFALAGKVDRGGLIEIPMGTTLREIVVDIGGGVGAGRRFKAVQIGGPSGGCVPARLADTPVDFESLRAIGAIMGSGGLVVLDDTSCMVDIARYFLQFTQEQSCGKCTFCRIGTKRMLEILERLCAGKATRQHLDELEKLAVQVGAGSLCGLGKTAPNPVLTTLKYFRDEYEAHLQGRCPAGKCAALIKYSINTDCTGCTICAQHCPVDAIPLTPYAQHLIDDAKCTRCDTCRAVCPEHAVEVK